MRRKACTRTLAFWAKVVALQGERLKAKLPPSEDAYLEVTIWRRRGTRSTTADVAAGSASSPTAGDLRPADAQQVRRWHPVTGQEAVHMRGGRVAWLAGVDHRDTPTRPAEHQRCAEPSRAATDHDDVPPVSG
jgi:hypothetical protein